MRKCCLVTGASRGIGKSVALALAKDHQLHVLVNYSRNVQAANQTIEEIKALGGTAELFPFRVEEFEQVNEAIANWLQNNPDSKIEVLVNNAGITSDNLLVFMEKNDFDSVVGINLGGTFNVTRAVINHMVRNRSGRIINMASLAGVTGVPGQTNYAASKGGIISLTQSLAQEVAKRNITVNAVAPGFIESDMTAELNADELKKLVPMNRFGKPEEVAAVVSFLASKNAAYITGEVININGGIL